MEKVKAKKKTVKECNLHKCPLQSDFIFHKRCPIKTCQHHNVLTSHRCLYMDRKVSSDAKTFTDKELKLYKFSASTSLRDVSSKRRLSLAQIRNITALYYYVGYISENCSRKKTYVLGSDYEIEEVYQRSNYRFRQLSIDLTWMLPHLINESLFEKFRKVSNISTDVTIKSMLGLTNSDYKFFMEKIESLT